MDIEQIIDDRGNIRRLGSLEPDVGMMAAFASALMAVKEESDDDIRRMITDPDRKPSRLIFGDAWICDQLSFGSCNGWATVEGLIRQMFLRGIRTGITRLSGSYCYAWMNGNRDNGSNLSDGMRVIQEHGAPPEAMVPANRIYRSQMPAGADAEAAKHKGFKCYAVKTLRGLRSALARRWPCVIAVHAGTNYQRLDKNGISGVDNGRGNHAVCVDDLRIVAGKEVMDHAGSWGLNMFDRGRSFLTFESVEQTMPYHTAWAMPTTLEAA